MFRRFAALLGTLLLVVTVSACSPGEEIIVNPDAVIIDVRTAPEYAEGHLDGATLLDLNNGDFMGAVATELDPDAEYLLYCRSGNRSGMAMQIMEQAGFTNVSNLGSVEQASKATGIEIVR